MYVSAHVLEREQVINIELRHVYPVVATVTNSTVITSTDKQKNLGI